MATPIAVLSLIKRRTRDWPVLALVLWGAGTAARQITSASITPLAAVLTVAEVVTIAAAFRLGGPLRNPWYSGGQPLRLAVCFVTVPLVASTLAVLAEHGSAATLQAWLTRYSGKVLGMLILTPLLLSWTDPQVRSETGFGGGRSHVGSTLASLVCIGLVLQEWYPPLVLLTFPVVIAVAWSHGLAGVTLVLSGAGFAGLAATVAGHGAIVDVVTPATSQLAQIQGLQLYLVAMVFASLPLAILLARQKALAQALARSNQARAEFLSVMSHEIRTPMTGVLGMADLLAAEPLTIKQQSFVEAMRASGDHLKAVIDDILDYSRIESGRLVIEPVTFELAELLEQLRSLLDPIAKAQGLALAMSVDSGVPPVLLGDVTRIKQVLLNLIGNGIKFTPAGKVMLRVRVDEGGEQVCLAFVVTDTGIGIAVDKIELLFQPFTQADASTSRTYGGSGLGLAISRRLAEGMGGKLTVKSEPGVGSTFTLFVPLKEAVSASAPAKPRAAPVHGRPKRILIAEDVDINRAILRTALGKQGHELVFAENGEEAYERARDEDFDLVLMDVQMPVLDGVAATRKIRALAGARGRVAIVGLTANVMAQEQGAYLEAGMNECQRKPIDWPALTQAINRYDGGGTRSSQQAATVTASQAAADGQPLVDEVRLGSLREFASKEEVAELVESGMRAICTAFSRLAETTDRDVVAKEAHRIKGTAGTLGLARIGEISARLETTAESGLPCGHSLRELYAAILQTGGTLNLPDTLEGVKPPSDKMA